MIIQSINNSKKYTGNLPTKNKLIEFIKNYVNILDNTELFSYYGDRQQPYNHPFIISLETDKHKYANAKTILQQLKFEPIKFTAIYGKDFEIKNPEIFNLFKNLSPNEIGCFLSHVILIYIISKQPNTDKYSIIFEDDIQIGPDIDTTQLKNKILSSTKYNANIIYLGKCLEQCYSMEPVENRSDIFYGKKPLCLHAYMIKNSFAKKVINYIESQSIYDIPIDLLILKIFEKKNDIIIFHPSLFRQNIQYDSNLRNKFSQQFSVMECRDSGTMTKYVIFLIIFLFGIAYIFYYFIRDQSAQKL